MKVFEDEPAGKLENRTLLARNLAEIADNDNLFRYLK
jgi:hypothetical protein